MREYESEELITAIFEYDESYCTMECIGTFESSYETSASTSSSRVFAWDCLTDSGNIKILPDEQRHY